MSGRLPSQMKGRRYVTGISGSNLNSKKFNYFDGKKLYTFDSIEERDAFKEQNS